MVRSTNIINGTIKMLNTPGEIAFKDGFSIWWVGRLYRNSKYYIWFGGDTKESASKLLDEYLKSNLIQENFKRLYEPIG